jgi:hypothetical protein
MVVLAVLAVIVSYPAVQRLQDARATGNAASAIGSLRVINSAQVTFSVACGEGFYAPNLPSLGKPPADGVNAQPFVGPDLSAASTVERGGYRIWIDATGEADAPAACNGLPPGTTTKHYVARAEPLPGNGTRYFATTDEATVYEGAQPVIFVGGRPTGDAKPVQ